MPSNDLGCLPLNKNLLSWGLQIIFRGAGPCSWVCQSQFWACAAGPQHGPLISDLRLSVSSSSQECSSDSWTRYMDKKSGADVSGQLRCKIILCSICVLIAGFALLSAGFAPLRTGFAQTGGRQKRQILK